MHQPEGAVETEVRRQHNALNKKMNAYFLTAISNVSVGEDLGRGDQFADTAFVTNSWSHVAPSLSRQFQAQVGQLESEFLKNAKLWVYSRAPLADPHELLAHVKSQLRLVSLFLNHLWLVRDNAANCETGFAFIAVPGGELFASNILAIHYSTADGNDAEVAFTREEIRQARGVFGILAFEAAEETRGLPALQRNEQRLERAHYFVQAARAQRDLGLKVGYYCSSLEALFATSPSELSHQLSERVAAFLGRDLQERLEVFKTCKRAYSVRSQVFHGARVEAKETGPLTIALDEYLRQVLRAAIGSDAIFDLFRKNPAEFESRMLRLVLGEPRDQVMAS